MSTAPRTEAVILALAAGIPCAVVATRHGISYDTARKIRRRHELATGSTLPRVQAGRPRKKRKA